jgi:predicted oxidoreductase
MQPSVYDAILPNMPLTLTVSTEPVASFFNSSMSAGLGSGGVHGTA